MPCEERKLLASSRTVNVTMQQERGPWEEVGEYGQRTACSHERCEYDQLVFTAAVF